MRERRGEREVRESEKREERELRKSEKGDERAVRESEKREEREETVAARSGKSAARMKRYGINGIQLWVLCLLLVK